jgi:hypothetical protein
MCTCVWWIRSADERSPAAATLVAPHNCPCRTTRCWRGCAHMQRVRMALLCTACLYFSLSVTNALTSVFLHALVITLTRSDRLHWTQSLTPRYRCCPCKSTTRPTRQSARNQTSL